MAIIGSLTTPTGTTGATGTSSTTQGTQNAASQSFDKDTFLKLLVAQLKYQDPSNPTDSSTFMNQTAQFSMVEQMQALTASQTSVATNSALQAATSMVGKQVTYLGADGKDVTGIANAATITNGTPTLTVGGTSVDLTKITKIENAPTAVATTP